MKLGTKDTVPLPFRQQDLADALGLSLVHTNKNLAELRQRKTANWARGVLEVMDPAQLQAVAMIEEAKEERRPLM